MTGQCWNIGEQLTDAKHISLFRSVPFSDPSASCLFLHHLFQEYQHCTDIQNKVLLAAISWSLARKFPWPVKYSLFSSYGVSLLQIKYFVRFWHVFSLRPTLRVHKLTFTVVFLAASPFHIFLWHHTSFLPTGWSLPTNAGGQEFLFSGNAEQLQKPYTSVYPESLRFF